MFDRALSDPQQHWCTYTNINGQLFQWGKYKYKTKYYESLHLLEQLYSNSVAYVGNSERTLDL